MNIKLIAGVVLVLLVIWAVFEFQRAGLPSSQDYLVPSGAQGNLPIPETEFEPVLQNADQEMRNRFSYADRLNIWQRLLRWLAIIATSAVTIIAGFFGRTLKPETSQSLSVEDVLDQSNKSQSNIRLIGVLLALSTVSGIFGQQLESESKTFVDQAVALNQSIIDAVAILYDTNSTEIQARLALRNLEVEISRP